jgi:hypothetical protein
MLTHPGGPAESAVQAKAEWLCSEGIDGSIETLLGRSGAGLAMGQNTARVAEEKGSSRGTPAERRVTRSVFHRPVRGRVERCSDGRHDLKSALCGLSRKERVPNRGAHAGTEI